MKATLELLNLLDELERQGTTVIDLVTSQQAVEPWRLYPGEPGIFDHHTRCQFYYYSHGSDHEAGHFHTVRPFADHMAHLVAISIGADGWPQAFFTLNLWAIGDASASAADLRRYVARFHLREHVGPSRLVCFVKLVFQAFGSEIERLQDEKVATLCRHEAAHPDLDVFEDRSLEILSRIEIDVRAAAAAAVA
jgi:hypothetical protein